MTGLVSCHQGSTYCLLLLPSLLCHGFTLRCPDSVWEEENSVEAFVTDTISIQTLFAPKLVVLLLCYVVIVVVFVVPKRDTHPEEGKGSCRAGVGLIPNSLSLSRPKIYLGQFSRISTRNVEAPPKQEEARAAPRFSSRPATTAPKTQDH